MEVASRFRFEYEGFMVRYCSCLNMNHQEIYVISTALFICPYMYNVIHLLWCFNGDNVMRRTSANVQQDGVLVIVILGHLWKRNTSTLCRRPVWVHGCYDSDLVVDLLFYYTIHCGTCFECVLCVPWYFGVSDLSFKPFELEQRYLFDWVLSYDFGC